MTVLLNYLTSACDHSYARILRWIRTISSFWLKWISPVARHVTAESKGTIEFWSAFACHVFDLHAAQTTNDFLFWLALFLYFFKIVLQTDLCRHSRRLVRSSYNRGLAIVPARGPKIHRYRITSYKRLVLVTKERLISAWTCNVTSKVKSVDGSRDGRSVSPGHTGRCFRESCVLSSFSKNLKILENYMLSRALVF